MSAAQTDPSAKKQRKNREVNRRFVLSLPDEVMYFLTTQYEKEGCSNKQQFTRLIMARGLRSMGITPSALRADFAQHLLDVAREKAAKEKDGTKPSIADEIDEAEYGLNF